MLQHVFDQRAQGFVVVHAPGGSNGPGVEDLSTLGAFPVDDLCDRLLAADPRTVSFGVEVEDVPFFMAARDGGDGE